MLYIASSLQFLHASHVSEREIRLSWGAWNGLLGHVRGEIVPKETLDKTWVSKMETETLAGKPTPWLAEDWWNRRSSRAQT